MFYLICTFSSSVEISAPSNKHHKKVEMILNKQVKVRSPKMFLNKRRKAYWRICGIFLLGYTMTESQQNHFTRGIVTVLF